MRRSEKTNLFTVNGLGRGEETKGNTVQWLVRLLKAHTVWRSGGWQGGHHIEHDDGREAALSFYGAGVFEGAQTHLAHMVISPVELCGEAFELEEKGILNPLSRITVDENCLVTVPFHRAISRITEIARWEDKKGTVGLGVGNALRDSWNPEISIRAGELGDHSLMLQKIEAIRRLKLSQAQELMGKCSREQFTLIEPEIALLHDEALVRITAEAFFIFPKLVQITDDRFLADLLSRPGSIVNEVSHGALHHPWYGDIPYVTQIDPTSQDVLSTVMSHNYKGEIVRIGVIRSYMTKHGGMGPFVTFSNDLTRQLSESHNNVATEWLGQFQNGFFDTVSLRYVLKFAGAIRSFDGLVLSFLDILRERSEWQVCEAYEYVGEADDVGRFFEIKNRKIVGIKVHPNDRDQAHYQYQFRLTQLLKDCRPVLRTLRSTSEKSLETVFIEYVEAQLGIPVLGKAYGPKIAEKELTPAGSALIDRLR